MAEFRDNLPLNGRVLWEGRVYVYRGFEGHNKRRCALTRPDDPHIMWVDRSVITPAHQQ
jgi:hypothetical protein